jgi:DeoR family fructose operon transcriptional repressor
MTVRRDIEELDAEGLVRRVRGGAVAPVVPRAFGERAATRSAAKITIARKAMSLGPTEGAVLFDASTTRPALTASAARLSRGGHSSLTHTRRSDTSPRLTGR